MWFPRFPSLMPSLFVITSHNNTECTTVHCSSKAMSPETTRFLLCTCYSSRAETACTSQFEPLVVGRGSGQADVWHRPKWGEKNPGWSWCRHRSQSSRNEGARERLRYDGTSPVERDCDESELLSLQYHFDWLLCPECLDSSFSCCIGPSNPSHYLGCI